MQLDSIVKVIHTFRADASDVLKLIKNSQKAHEESKVLGKILSFPLTQLKAFFKSAKLLKSSIALQTTILGGLAYLGYSERENLPLWAYGVLILLWYLFSVFYGFFAMQRLSKDNPFFFYKLFKIRQPALYRAFEELAKNNDSFDKLYGDLTQIQLALSLSGDNLLQNLANIEEAFNQKVEYHKNKSNLLEKKYKSLLSKITKSVQSSLKDKTSFEDLNLLSTPILVYKEEMQEYIKVYDTTDIDVKDSYAYNDFFKDYPYVNDDSDSTEDLIFQDVDSVEIYTWIIKNNNQTWTITFFNVEALSVVSEFFLGYIIPSERIMFLLKEIIKHLK